MKILSLLRTAMFGTALLATAGASFAQQPKVLNLAFVGRTTAPEGIAMTAFAEEIKTKTNGRIEIRLHPGGALGGDREVLEGLQIGTVDLTVPSTSVIANFVPEVQVFDIPFLFRDFDHAQAVLDGPIGQEILAKFKAKGLQGLAFGGIGFRQLTNSKRPVNGPEDVKGLKIRTQENQIHLQVWRALGALPTPMALPEVFTALQQGVVDGQENPIGAILNNKFGQVQKYLTITNHAFTPIGFVMAPRAFEALSPDDRQLFLNAAKHAMAICKDEVAKVEKTGIEELRKQGLQIVEKVDTAKFQELLKGTFADLGKRFGEATIARIKDQK
ncbi:MAG: TRAP transporter substrate-binding protein [Bosea sp. (in: a-proteobacteria)]|uniref:TRAP transporter substrate-binding protein n=1 Tax=Bosea sp. (in: a-proteobacteria) TaxID=1871050 RepID=UPI003F7C7B32